TARDEERERTRQRAESRDDLVGRYRTAVISEDHAFAPLRQQLVTEILASNAGSDREVKAQLKELGTADRRRTLRSVPTSYLTKLIESCLDRLRPIAGSIPVLTELVVAHNSHNAPMVEQVFGELVQAKSADFLAAYARAVEDPGYYLRDIDLEVMADVQQRALFIYRESDVHPGQFVEHTRHNTEAGNPMQIYHAGAHYEHAEEKAV
ncbi:MAG: hypothetical protein H0T79_23875, partial [Deltaproteobacteria bacterium]|nr:hypothetical protein [Deltaproteobacteria bacterium]